MNDDKSYFSTGDFIEFSVVHIEIFLPLSVKDIFAIVLYQIPYFVR